jgi:hypothetical protein
MPQWTALDGRTYFSRFNAAECSYGKPRRFCVECGKLRECFYSSLHANTPHHCLACSKRFNIPTTRDAFQLRQSPSRQLGAERFPL